MLNEQNASPSDVLFREIYLPAYIKTASDRGFAPKSPEELDNHLSISTMLRTNEAQTQGSVVKEAEARLASALYGDAPAPTGAPTFANVQLSEAGEAALASITS